MNVLPADRDCDGDSGIGWLLTASGATAAITVAYVLLGVTLVLTQYTLNDEGLLTHYWARWVLSDFLPVIFFQKLKPVLCVLYALPASFGIRATMVTHVLISAAGIPLMVATARSLGHRLPNVAGLILAFSPLYFYGGSAGFANNDGVVGIVLVLYLLRVRRAPLIAGLIAGLLPWVRTELATFCAVLAAYALFAPRDRWLLGGMPLFALVYGLAGAVYHGDPLWMIHYPPAAASHLDNPMWGTELIGFRYLLEPAIAVTPLAALAVALPLERLDRLERALIGFALLSALTINVLPMFRIGNFGSSPRYLLHLLPALAILIGRALDRWWDEIAARPSAGMLATVGLTAVWIVTRQPNEDAVTLLLAAYALMLAAAWFRAGKLLIILAAVLALGGPLLPLHTEVGLPGYLKPMLGWLRSQEGAGHGRIYTNAHLLGPYLEQHLPEVDVYEIATAELTKELIAMTNPDNGQRAALLRLGAADLYGKMLFPPVTPDDLGNGSVLALREDPRLPLLLPSDVWANRLEVVVQTPEYRIARVVPERLAVP